MSDHALFTMAMRLRKCRRCGHYPCPCCENWCDAFHLPDNDPLLVSKALTPADTTFVASTNECPCSDNHECVFTARDLDHNRSIFADMQKICDDYDLDVSGFGAIEDEYGEHIVVYGRPRKPRKDK